MQLWPNDRQLQQNTPLQLDIFIVLILDYFALLKDIRSQLNIYRLIMQLQLVFKSSTDRLRYTPTVIAFVEQHYKNNNNRIIPFLNLQNIAKRPSILTSLFSNKQHSALFKLFLEYLCNPQDPHLPYHYIQQSLRSSVKDYLGKNDKRIQISKCEVLSSQMMDTIHVKGVFLHRKYNLNADSYNVSSNQNAITYKMKQSLSYEAIKEYERVIRRYLSDGMEKHYYKGYNDFLQDGIITRYIYKIVAHLSLQIKVKNETITLASQPTQHLLQIQSIINRYSNLEEFYLSDIDFSLQGNHYFKQKLL